VLYYLKTAIQQSDSS